MATAISAMSIPVEFGIIQLDGVTYPAVTNALMVHYNDEQVYICIKDGRLHMIHGHRVSWYVMSFTEFVKWYPMAIYEFYCLNQDRSYSDDKWYLSPVTIQPSEVIPT